MSFRDDLKNAINRNSVENTSDTPDFILADYLLRCLDAFERASLAREKWYGTHLHIGMDLEKPVSRESIDMLNKVPDPPSEPAPIPPGEPLSSVYHERNMLVCALSKIYPSLLGRHPSDQEWDDDWRWIVYVNLPTGQVSWHIHDSELSLFDHLDRKN
jgi:hypothetical protein